jgi:ABC-type Fe3+-hydroxamate transport system substrate-binding protein
VPVVLRAAWIPPLVSAVVACATPAPPRVTARVLVDDLGDSVAIPAVPTRIASLNPATTELVFAIGAGGRLIGRTRWDTWPDSARLLPDLGDGLRPNIEAVLAARPDLVLLYASEENRVAAGRFRAAGVATLAFRIDRIADFARVTRLLGVVVGDTGRAAIVVDSVQATLARVRAAAAGRPGPRVVWPLWPSPLMVVGRGSFLHELVEIAGGTNVFGDLAAPSPVVSFEEVLRRDADALVTTPTGRQTYAADPRWRATRAVRAGRVVVIDTATTLRPGVRLGEAAEGLARRFGTVPR